MTYPIKRTEPASTEPESVGSESSTVESAEPTAATASADPVVADAVGHPVGVGLGALGAGAAGAAIGAVAGPIGMLVGAVVGAVAGGFVGEEMASAGSDAVTDNPDASYTEPDLARPTSLATGGSGASTLGYSSEPSSGSLFSGSDENARSGAIEIPSQETAREEARISRMTDPLEDKPAESSPSSGTFETGHAPTAEPPAEHLIRTSAYYRYVEREAEGRPGHHVEDWLSAERELKG